MQKPLLPITHYADLYKSLKKWTSLDPLDAVTLLYIMRTAEEDSNTETLPSVQTDAEVLNFIGDLQEGATCPSIRGLYVAIQIMIDTVDDYCIDQLQEYALDFFARLNRKISRIYQCTYDLNIL